MGGGARHLKQVEHVPDPELLDLFFADVEEARLAANKRLAILALELPLRPVRPVRAVGGRAAQHLGGRAGGRAGRCVGASRVDRMGECVSGQVGEWVGGGEWAGGRAGKAGRYVGRCVGE